MVHHFWFSLRTRYSSAIFIRNVELVFFPGDVFNSNTSSGEGVGRIPSPVFVGGGFIFLFRKVCEAQGLLPHLSVDLNSEAIWACTYVPWGLDFFGADKNLLLVISLL